MLTERVNKRHCGIEGEEKPTSVLDGEKKSRPEQAEKETDFKAPGSGIHSTWRQEVKRKRF